VHAKYFTYLLTRLLTYLAYLCDGADLALSDTGVYTCIAVSEIGETHWTSSLVVEQSSSSVVFHRTPDSSTFPGAPSKPHVYNVTDGTLVLSWKPNDNNGASAVQSYSIEYFSQQACQVISLWSGGTNFKDVKNWLVWRD